MKDTPRRLVLPDLYHCSSSNRACSSWPIHDVLGVPYVQTGTRHEPAPVGDSHSRLYGKTLNQVQKEILVRLCIF